MKTGEISDSNCLICLVKKSDYSYECCHKDCCRECVSLWYGINRNCPFCRGKVDYKPLIKVNSLSSRFFEFVEAHPGVKNSLFYYQYLKYVDMIDNISKKNLEFKLQVANLKKIHVFHYRSIDEIEFIYHDGYNLVKVKGGDYYFYDEPAPLFNWWLHGFVKEVS